VKREKRESLFVARGREQVVASIEKKFVIRGKGEVSREGEGTVP